MKIKDVVFDLDGTLALCDHRRHHVEGAKKNWQAFFDECDKDAVNEPVANLLRYYRDNPNYCVWIMSGRSGDDVTYSKTVKWLEDNDLKPDTVEGAGALRCFHMRKPGDKRHDTIVKKEMVESVGLTPENTEVVFDDRRAMVNAWREWGFTCFEVEHADF